MASLTPAQLIASALTALHEGGIARPVTLLSLGFVFRRGDLGTLKEIYKLVEVL